MKHHHLCINFSLIGQMVKKKCPVPMGRTLKILWSYRRQVKEKKTKEKRKTRLEESEFEVLFNL